MSHHVPKKIDLRPKKHHGWTALIFLFGFFLPPIAVALRFGIGTDFFINCFLCICGYLPSHGHNFYIQNIRNNSSKKRTPKWARQLGVVDNTEELRRAKKSQWAKRYDERNPNSTHDNAELAEGEEGANYVPDRTVDPEEVERRRREGLWGREEEEYYNADPEPPNRQHWHYPANFEGTDVAQGPVDPDKWKATGGKSNLMSLGRKSKSKKSNNYAAYAPSGPDYGSNDRFASNNNHSSDDLDIDRNNSRRREDNVPAWDAEFDRDVEEWGSSYGNSRGKKNTASAGGGGGGYGNGSGNGNAYGNGSGNGSAGGREEERARVGGGRSAAQENWDHQF